LKSAQAGLANLLQLPVSMKIRKTVQVPVSTALKDIGPEDRVIALDLAPVRGCGFLFFPPSLLFLVLDILLATPQTTSMESASDDAGRVVTGIELHILREFFEVFTRSLRDAWEPFCPVAFDRISAEDDESGMSEKYGDDLGLILGATVDLAGMTADVRLVVPAFLARMTQLNSKPPLNHSADSVPVRASILNSLGDAVLRLDAVLDGKSIRIRHLLDLAPGQVLTFGNAESFDCLVNSRRQFTGQLVASNGRCAFQIDTLPCGGGSRFMGEPAADR